MWPGLSRWVINDRVKEGIQGWERIFHWIDSWERRAERKERKKERKKQAERNRERREVWSKDFFLWSGSWKKIPFFFFPTSSSLSSSFFPSQPHIFSFLLFLLSWYDASIFLPMISLLPSSSPSLYLFLSLFLSHSLLLLHLLLVFHSIFLPPENNVLFFYFSHKNMFSVPSNFLLLSRRGKKE